MVTKEEMQKYMSLLETKMARATSKTSFDRYCSEVELMREAYCDFFGEEIDYKGKTIITMEKERFLLNQNEKALMESQKDILSNAELYNIISEGILGQFQNMDFIGFNLMPKYKYKKSVIEDIVLSFFNSYDERSYKIAKEILESGINIMQSKSVYSAGFCFYFPTINKSMILVDPSEYNLFYGVELAHEIAHYIDFTFFSLPNKTYCNLLNSLFLEVSTHYYQRLFLEYVKNNRINVRDANVLINDCDSMLYDFSDTLYSYTYESNLGNINYKKNEYNFYNLREKIKYTIGILFALKFSSLYKENKQATIKNMYRFMCENTQINIKDALTGYGIDAEELVYSSLKESVEPHFKDLKRMLGYKE